MRIALIHEIFVSGASRCAEDLHRELGHRHEVCYIPRSELDVGSVDRVLGALEDFKPQIVNCHSFFSHLPYDFLSTVANLYPTCFTLHDPRPVGTMGTPCWDCRENATCRNCPLLASQWRRMLRNPYYNEREYKKRTHEKCPSSLRLLCPSQWLIGRLAEHELRRFELHHIPNGIDVDHFRRRANSRDSFGLPAESPVVLFVSSYESRRTINSRKGLPDLAEAFERYVLPKLPNATLAVAGDAFAPNHARVKPLGIIPYERLPELYSAGDVYVTPTLADNLPYTVLEAMAVEIPVVASNVGGIPEQVVDGETGILIPPSNPLAIGNAILEILLDPTRARMMGLNGRRRVEKMFSMHQFVGSYEQVFQEMALTIR
jgi:glycosyltransferase involved in cell wall biosynthesis